MKAALLGAVYHVGHLTVAVLIGWLMTLVAAAPSVGLPHPVGFWFESPPWFAVSWGVFWGVFYYAAIVLGAVDEWRDRGELRAQVERTSQAWLRAMKEDRRGQRY